MKTSKQILIFAFSLMLVLSGSFAAAKVSQQEADRLKTDLMPTGGERAGNAEGTIPAWDGGGVPIPAGWNGKPGDFLPDPFKDDKVLFSINAANMDQYADKLSEGTKWLLKRHPDTFRLDVYPTRRTMKAPQYVYDYTYKNALNASMDEARQGIQNAYGGIPFPIPKHAEEIVYNHILRWQGASRYSTSRGYNVSGSGTVTLTNASFSAENYPLYYPGEPNYEADLWHFYGPVTGPARRKGELLLVVDAVNPLKQPRKAWQYLPGQRRVRRAPTLSYDNPNPGSAITTYDDAFQFNGALDRFDWKIIGKKEMYMPYNCYKQNLVEKIEDFALAGHFNPDLVRWELHRMWVVEATVKEGKRHVYGRRIFFFDEDSWFLQLKDQYDNRDNFWRFNIGMNYFDYSSTPNLVTMNWMNWDVTVPFWNPLATYIGVEHLPITREKEINPKEWFTPAYLRKAGRR